MLCVSTAFIAWDTLATIRGHWSFNSLYLVGPKLFGLPFEEILFFITVPFSCLFAYEALAYFVKETKPVQTSNSPLIIGLALVVSSIAFMNKEYTFLAVLSVGISVIVAHKLVKGIFFSKLYWSYIVLTFALFLVFNYLLTSLPIVEYSNQAIIGLRVSTIPVEDFMFNFSMLTLYLAIHLSFARKLNAS
jgi:lycopene cyclase domain-containing protein